MARKMNLFGTGDRIARALVDGTASGEVEWSESGHANFGAAQCRIVRDATPESRSTTLEVVSAETPFRLILQGPVVEELARVARVEVVEVRGVHASVPTAGAFAAN